MIQGDGLFESRMQRIIEWGQCDPAGIVFFPRYWEMGDFATATLLARATGMPKNEMIDHFGIVGVPVVALDGSFHAPCSFGEEVEITSTVESLGRTSFAVKHQFRRGSLLCVELDERRVWAVRGTGGASDISAAPLPEPLVRILSGRESVAAALAGNRND